MAIGIDPLVDFACKTLLGSPEHPAITLHFLNTILDGSPEITEVEILNPIVEKDYEDDKYSILDVLARDSTGHRLNIEVQRTKPVGLRERLTYYAATQLVEQLDEGESYTRLRPSIGICILDAILFRAVPDLHLDFRLLNKKHGVSLTDHLQIHLLELPKYRPPSDNRKITDPIEQWCYFFRRAKTLTPEEITRRLPNPIFQEATGVLEMIARNPQQRSMYEARLKAERDAQAKLDYARQEGLEKGEAIGSVKILRELLNEHSPTDDDLRGLSVAELAALLQDFQKQLRARG